MVRWWKRRGALIGGLGMIGVLGCGGVAEEGELPPNVQDPATLQTPSGALARYRGALGILPEAFDWFMAKTAILTDELAGLPGAFGFAGRYTGIDIRRDLSNFDSDYNRLHQLRAQAREARGFLAAYAPDTSPALRGHLYAVEGYAEVLLADLFCSGIPLSTVDFGGDYTLATGSSTADVYTHAIALLDSALTLAGDSVDFQRFAAVTRGRALLALGEYAAAAAAVAGVPDNFSYQVVYRPPAMVVDPDGFFIPLRLFWALTTRFTTEAGTPSVGNQEGTNGLDYLSSATRGSPLDSVGPDVLGHILWLPAKYPRTGPAMLTLADGIEARLIEAEAALRRSAESGEWLTVLNALRTDGMFDVNPSDPADTLWHAGSGGVPGLKRLEDPSSGTFDARVDLLFRERAFWLYVTGHRQGDLRRLIREYGRAPSEVYPQGTYPGGGQSYGADITAPVPTREQELNPKYTGCIHRGA